MEATARVSPPDMAKIQASIERVARNTSRETGDVIIQLMILSIQSASAATKQSKALRKVWDLRRRRGRKRPGWAVEVYLANSQRRIFYTDDRIKKERMRRIARRGLAKNVWISTIGYLPGGRRFTGEIPQDAAAGGVGRVGGFVRSAIVENKLKYISKIAPDSAAIGLRKGLNKFNRSGKRQISAAAEKGFK
jgi:hypothetical protein